MIIDTHTHFYDPHRPEGVPWPSPDTPYYRTTLPEHYRALPGAEGVSATVVVEASKWVEDNQWILDLADREPFIVGFVGRVEPDVPTFAEQLARFASHPRFKGIRCDGACFDDLESGGLVADMALLVEHNLSLDVLGNTGCFSAVAEVARRLPELRIIVNHAGLVRIDGVEPDPAWLRGIAELGACPNVYMKASGMMELGTEQPALDDLDYYRPTLDAMWHTFGTERLIFGSNWPVCEIAGEFSTFLNLVTTYFAEKCEAASRRYFAQNAIEAYALSNS